MTGRVTTLRAMPLWACLGLATFGLATFGLACLGLLCLGAAGPAMAQQPDECRVTDGLLSMSFPLPNTVRAIAAKRLSILVVGAGSSQLPGPNGVKKAYPARLQQALAERLPGIEVKVAADVKPRRTAADMVKTLEKPLSNAKPALMIWQTATVDAMQASDLDQFSQSLDRGVNIARSAGADVIFINPQYSPRTESMIALAAYVEIMRWVALQHEVPLFDRFNIMKDWADQGTFDLYSATKKLDMAERVHNCLGRLLAALVLEAAKPGEPHTEGGR